MTRKRGRGIEAIFDPPKAPLPGVTHADRCAVQGHMADDDLARNGTNCRWCGVPMVSKIQRG